MRFRPQKSRLNFQIAPNPSHRHRHSQLFRAGRIDFGTVAPGTRLTEKVEIDNQGGIAHQLHFIYSEPNSWFRVTRGQRLHADKPVPIEVDIAIDTAALEPEKAYNGWIDINMDDASTRVDLTVQLSAAPARFRPSPRLVS